MHAIPTSFHFLTLRSVEAYRLVMNSERRARDRKERAAKKAVVEAPSKRSRKAAAFEQALAGAFRQQEQRGPASREEVDAYGKGNPEDRLQFGYAPALAEEAIAFHSRISAHEWVSKRRESSRIAIKKGQKLAKPNCEPFASMLKLKNHWSNVSQFNVDRRGECVSAEEADSLLDMLAARQRVGT